jgi:glucose-6-phosphate 1-dehydrogenase
MNKENQVAETVVEGIAEDVNVAEGGCVLEGALEPCALVIIGASGDLTARKLVPSLFNLYRNKGLPEPFLIVGCGRTKMTDEAFRESMKVALVQNSRMDQEKWEAFAEGLFYCPIQ